MTLFTREKSANLVDVPPPSDEATRERFIAIGEIAAEVAHELRNALQIITASAYLARQDPAASLPHIQKIERNARLAHGIVDDLMSLARGEPAHAEPILVFDLVCAARGEMDPGMAIWEDVIPKDARVRAHLGLCTRLFHVLYENAIHASSPRAPRIRTSARFEEASLVLEVADDGPGVPEELATRIFDPLVTGRAGGTGLGLSLASRIARAHGGVLSLAARQGDVKDLPGATFRLVLPTTRP